jgi:DNA-binding MarR family transcriptional regulator
MIPASDDRRTVTDRVLADYEALMRTMAPWHMPQFLSIDITMQQAKLLVLASLEHDATMSALASRLGVTLPTVTGLVDRLVEHRLLERREDAADRRHVRVVVTPEGEAALARFRELGAQQLRRLLDALDPDDLGALARGVSALADHAARLAAGADMTERTPA